MSKSGRKPKGADVDKLSIRMELTGELKDKFIALMKVKGATTRKGLCHILITEAYEKIQRR